MTEIETEILFSALRMGSQALKDDFTPASPILQQYVAALKPLKSLIHEATTYEKEPMKEMCRLVKTAVFPDQPEIRDLEGLMETIMVKCIEWAFLVPKVLGDKFPFEEKAQS